jgi:pyruvate dehydrogenase E2 component (dihydrolipoamide acetyltransferase)
VRAIEVSVVAVSLKNSLVLMLETDEAGAPSATPSAPHAPETQAAVAPEPEPEPAAERAASPVPAATGVEAPLSEEMARKYGASAPDPRAPVHRPSPTAAIEEAPDRGAHHATPAVRRFARELGVDIAKVRGTGRKGRILKEDVKGFVKQALSGPAATTAPTAEGGMGIPPVPAVDFSKFGPVEERRLSRIKRISGPFLHRSWLNVPHVTHHDEADVTELEAFRKSLKGEAEKKGLRITALAFIMKAVAKTLAEFPSVNASLSPDGESLILKQYFPATSTARASSTSRRRWPTSARGRATAS